METTGHLWKPAGRTFSHELAPVCRPFCRGPFRETAIATKIWVGVVIDHPPDSCLGDYVERVTGFQQSDEVQRTSFSDYDYDPTMACRAFLSVTQVHSNQPSK
ncbi:hypothetical protein Bbelb_212800 [Branchiostoma belcheri]|nr:hypothetical protein Bbelb_212800 [Branchiostoma belcheri]